MIAINKVFERLGTRNSFERSKFYLYGLLFLGMLAVSLFSQSLSLLFAYQQQKERLIDLLNTQEVFINKILDEEKSLHLSKINKDEIAQHVEDIFFSNSDYKNFLGQTGEFVIGKFNGTNIIFLMGGKYKIGDGDFFVPIDSDKAQPMRLALMGESGAGILKDYAGNLVLAAYKPFPELNWGLVAKINLTEVLQPYIFVVVICIFFSLMFAIPGTIMFYEFMRFIFKKVKSTNDLNKILINNSTHGIVICDKELKIYSINNTYAEMIRVEKDSLAGLNFSANIKVDFRAFIVEQIKNMGLNYSAQSFECVLIRSDNFEIHVKIKLYSIDIDNKHMICFNIEDIDESRRKEVKLAIFANICEHSSEAIFVTNAENNIIQTNKAFEQITGFTFEDSKGKNPRILKSGMHDNIFYAQMYYSLHINGKWKGEIWNKKPNGEIYPSLQSITVLYDESGNVDKYVSLLTDITAQKIIEQQLSQKAHFDSLTNLPNRASFNEEINRLILKSSHGSSIFALFFIDVNKFKEVNDTFGHKIGDEYLKFIANFLKGSLRASDFVARLAGDEFVVLLESLKQENEAALVANNLISKIAASVNFDGHEIFPSISIGISLYPKDGDSADMLLQKADSAMYIAKHKDSLHYHQY